jgi:hypothetical protein
MSWKGNRLTDCPMIDRDNVHRFLQLQVVRKPDIGADSREIILEPALLSFLKPIKQQQASLVVPL